MATYNKFQDFVEQVLSGIHTLTAAGNVVKAYLSNAAPSASADAVKADLAEITAQNGYPAGGDDAQNTLSETTGTATVATTDIVWTSSGAGFGPFQYVAHYNDTAASDNLICWHDYGSAITPANGETFTVNYGASLFTLA